MVHLFRVRQCLLAGALLGAMLPSVAYSQQLAPSARDVAEVRVPLETPGRGLPGREHLQVIDGAGAGVPFASRESGGTGPGAPAEAAPDAPSTVKPIDPGRWRHRRRVLFSGSGVFEIQLPPEVVSRSPHLEDVRLVSGGREIPYILEPNGPELQVAIPLEPIPAGRDGKVSRWRLAFPYPGLPLTGLRCTVGEPVFRRVVSLFEESAPAEGGRRFLVSGVWERAGAPHGEGDAEFAFPLLARVRGDALIIEIDDAENLPLRVKDCAISWRTARLLFKAAPGQEILLLYGNQSAGSPRYDLAVLSEEILAADVRPAALADAAAPEPGGGASPATGWGRVVFWGALALVVIVLVGAIARLLPATKKDGTP